MTRDLTKLLLFPTLSWSSMSSWEYAKKYNNQEEWYQQYVLGIKNPSNSTMEAGTEIGQKLWSDSTFLPEVPRPSIYEYEIKNKIHHISIIGHLDGWSSYSKELLEYKTSVRETRWTQSAVHEWGQITFYCLLLWLKHKVRPEDIRIRLVAIPTDEHGDFSVKLSKRRKVKIFETNRTMRDLALFGIEIKKVHKEMQEYVDNHS